MVQNTKYKIQSTKYKIQSTKYKVQSTKYKVQSTKYKVQSTNLNSILDGFNYQLFGFKVLHVDMNLVIVRVVLHPRHPARLRVRGHQRGLVVEQTPLSVEEAAVVKNAGSWIEYAAMSTWH